MDLTLEDAKVFLASLGIVLPDAFLQLIVDQINSVNQCLTDAGYSPGTIALIKYYSLALIGIMQPNRQVTQQRAPSGASQSFAFGTLEEGYKKYFNLLSGLDTAGCMGAIIPDDPNAANCALFIGKPEGYCG
ncbi:hypothetical protein D3C77_106090 [compost metagenome]